MRKDDLVTDHAQNKGAFRSLLRWYRPYLQGSGKTLTVGLTCTAIMLTCQAAIPLVFETLLHHGQLIALGTLLMETVQLLSVSQIKIIM